MSVGPEDGIPPGAETSHGEEGRPGAAFWVGVALGWTAIGIGLFGLVDHPRSASAFKVLRLLIGLNVVNDAVVVPAVLLLALAVRRMAPRWFILPAQVWFIAAGSVSVYAYPLVGGFGRSKVNASILPHDYAHSYLIVLGCITAFSALLAWRSRRRARVSMQ
ncbi:MAG TPA: hypothetical protein VL961_05155 [Acidimicrobiales bacterium]|nr:hypothetical protein [Acidimicrobiales bacterium]